jgi:polyhydroxyalkanoate synthase
LLEIHFLLTSSGHNDGIVSGPVHPKRRHHVRMLRGGETPLVADEWSTTTGQTGFGVANLGGARKVHSSTDRGAPPEMGAPTEDYKAARGRARDYVRQP